MMYNRRDFIKQGLATLIGLAIPISTEIIIEFVDMKFPENIDIFSHIEIKYDENKHPYAITHIDENKMWENIRLIDNFGNEWQTNDKGNTWSYGWMSFNVSEYQNTI